MNINLRYSKHCFHQIKMGFFVSKYFSVLSIIILLFQSLLLYLPIVAGKDTLFPGDQINNLRDSSSSTLLSSNGKFTLGFYTIPGSFTYLGIWLTNELESKTLWIANRDLPIDGEAILTMDDSGSLRVMNRNNAILYNVSHDKVGGLGNKNNSIGKLLDSGNFMVYDIVTNRTIWESFDHPTDTLIPGMKLGYNLTTKKNWELTSRANDNFPTSGSFTLRLKQYQKSPQLLIYRHGELYWASGPWDESIGTFERLYYMNQSRFDLTYDPSGMYLIARLIESGASTPALLQLSPKGGFPDIDNFQDFCFGFFYGSGSGCVVSGFPHCRASGSSVHDFYRWDIGPSHYFGQNSKIDDNSSISLGDCMERCWNDCDCVACSTYNDNGTGCIYETEVDPNVVVGGVEVDLQASVYVLFRSGNHPTKSRWLLFFLTIVPVLVLAYVMARIHIIKGKENRRRDDIIHQLTGSNSFNYGDELERGIQDAPNVKIFSLKAILAATNNFSDENKLGQGGYGPVYKGELSDGRKIAVKRLSKTSGQGFLEFKSELILISKLQHTNLVRLYGCCIHQEERMLIYEFMPNKSLDFFLFDDDKKAKIDWHNRLQIIEGIAQGLLYLHMYSRMRVVHRDLKVSNVLLDENMNPKIADFGMARIFQHDMSVLMTKRVAGTYGYMAPEYVSHGTFSIKSDVFSFGVLILEIVSGKKNSKFHSLLRYAWELWQKEATQEMKDEVLGESIDVDQLLRTIHVGLLCVQEHANDRPSVAEVIFMLNNDIANIPIPKKPVFFMHPDEVEPLKSREHLLGNNIQGSVNALTITTMEGR